MPASVTSTSLVAENGRIVQIVGCDDAPSEVEILCQAYNLIKDNYVDPVSDERLAEGALEGLQLLDGTSQRSTMVCVAPSEEFSQACDEAPTLAEDTSEAVQAMLLGMAGLSLDPHSTYLDPDLLALIDEEQGGSVEGIGALVIAEDSSTDPPVTCGLLSESCRLVIVSTIPGSPAEAAGILADDVVTAVDGATVDGMTIEEVTTFVRGPAGSKVTLTILRGDGTFDVPITRAAVVVPVVSSEVFGKTGYLRLNQFTENAGDQTQQAIFNMLESGIDTLVFDLRNNPGGFLSTAIDIASEFLPDGRVVETRSPTSNQTYEVTGAVIVPADVRVIVLVNRGSASASELVAALLQERGRAELIGENTFGKNTVQQQFGLSNGGALKLTVARWLTPGGLDFGGVGVTPDVFEDFPPDLTAQAVVDLALSVG